MADILTPEMLAALALLGAKVQSQVSEVPEEEVSSTEWNDTLIQSILDLSSGAANGLAGKANTSHTQTASTITDFNAAVDARIPAPPTLADLVDPADGVLIYSDGANWYSLPAAPMDDDYYLYGTGGISWNPLPSNGVTRQFPPDGSPGALLSVHPALMGGDDYWDFLQPNNDGDVLTLVDGVPVWTAPGPVVPVPVVGGEIMVSTQLEGFPAQWTSLPPGVTEGDVLTMTSGAPTWAAGPVVMASARATDSTGVSDSLTVVPDDALILDVPSNGWYHIRGTLLFSSQGLTDCGFTLAFLGTGPWENAECAISVRVMRKDTKTFNLADPLTELGEEYNHDLAGEYFIVEYEGVIIPNEPGSTGTVAVAYAQGTRTLGNTVLQAGSTIVVTKT